MSDPSLMGPQPRRPCTRYIDNGLRCANTTDHVDGWCRQDGCPGFTRPTKGTGVVRKRWYSHPINPDPCPLDSYDVSTLSITRKTIDRFLEAHGTDRREAEAQIRSLAEDLVNERRWSINEESWVYLSKIGFFLAVSPDLLSSVDYRTSHRERTYAQVRTGVPSRFEEEGRSRRRRRLRQRREEAFAAVGAEHTYDMEQRLLRITFPDGRSIEGETYPVATMSGWSGKNWSTGSTRNRGRAHPGPAARERCSP